MLQGLLDIVCGILGSSLIGGDANYVVRLVGVKFDVASPADVVQLVVFPYGEEGHLPRLETKLELARRLDLLQKHKIPGVSQNAIHQQLLADVLAPTHDSNNTVDPGQAFGDIGGAGLPLGAFKRAVGVVVVSFEALNDTLVDLVLVDVLRDRVEEHQLLLGEAMHQELLESDECLLRDMVWPVGIAVVGGPQRLDLLVDVVGADGLALLLQRSKNVGDLDGLGWLNRLGLLCTLSPRNISDFPQHKDVGIGSQLFYSFQAGRRLSDHLALSLAQPVQRLDYSGNPGLGLGGLGEGIVNFFAMLVLASRGGKVGEGDSAADSRKAARGSLRFTSEAYKCTGSTRRKHQGKQAGLGWAGLGWGTMMVAVTPAEMCDACVHFGHRLILPSRFHVRGASSVCDTPTRNTSNFF